MTWRFHTRYSNRANLVASQHHELGFDEGGMNARDHAKGSLVKKL